MNNIVEHPIFISSCYNTYLKHIDNNLLTDFITKLLSKTNTGLITSINDIRDKEFSGVKLSAEERFALSNFDKYRINVLNSQTEEEKFHYHY